MSMSRRANPRRGILGEGDSDGRTNERDDSYFGPSEEPEDANHDFHGVPLRPFVSLAFLLTPLLFVEVRGAHRRSSTMPNATASSAVMYVSRSNAASTSFAPFPVCFCMMALSDPRVRSALDALMMMSVVCPLMT